MDHKAAVHERFLLLGPTRTYPKSDEKGSTPIRVLLRTLANHVERCPECKTESQINHWARLISIFCQGMGYPNLFPLEVQLPMVNPSS